MSPAEPNGSAGAEEGRAPPGAPFSVDALNRRVPLEPPPRRILSLVPSVTECLFDLGAGDRVVGRTDYCISPHPVIDLPSVGGPKSLSIESVLALQPDLVLANVEENDREQVTELIRRELRVHVSYPRDLEDVGRFLLELGTLLPVDAEREAQRLRTALAARPTSTAPTACLIWRGPYMTANEDTLTHSILEAAGARNVFAKLPRRYPTLSEDELAACAARVVLLPSEPYAFSAGEIQEVRALVPHAEILAVPGEWVTWYGTRVPQALEGLRTLLAPFRD